MQGIAFIFPQVALPCCRLAEGFRDCSVSVGSTVIANEGITYLKRSITRILVCYDPLFGLS